MKNYIIERIKEYADVNPDLIALKYGATKITYKDLNMCTLDIANQLYKKLSNTTSNPIVIYCTRNEKFIIYALAVLRAGNYYIPFEEDTPLARVMNVCEELGNPLVMTDNNEMLNMKNLNCFVETYKNNQNWCDIDYSFDLEKLIYCIYTSGTSGFAKGVQITYENLLNLLESFQEILYGKIAEKINIGVLASFAFDASIKQIYCSLYFGHTLTIAPRDIKYFGRKIIKFHNNNNIAICDCTPTHLKMMVLDMKNEIKVNCLLVGGEQLEWELIQKMYKKTKVVPIIINLYGPTECCVDVSYHIVDSKEVYTKSGNMTIGQPLKNTKLLIMNKNGEEIKENNEEGELYVVGKQVGAGYWGNETDAFYYDNIMKQRVYKTNDMAFRNTNNEIILTRRKGSQVKLNGNRIDLLEIANVIRECSGYETIVQIVSKSGVERLTAFVLVEYNVNFSEKEIKKKAEEQLPRYMRPQVYRFIQELPVTSNGKLDIKMLHDL